MASKIKLKLDEENEIEFALSIKGSVSESTSTETKTRFSIIDEKTGFSCAFPAAKNADGALTILVPKLENIFDIDKEYKGMLEVFVGGRYFTPTIVDIEFFKNFKIEATIIEKKKIEDPIESEDPVEPNNLLKTIVSLSINKKIIEKAVIVAPQEKKPKAKKPEKIVTNKYSAPITKSESIDPFVAYRNKLESLIEV